MRNTALLYSLVTITTSVLAQHNHHYNDIDRSNDQHFVRAALPIALGAAITGSALYTININNNSTGYLYKAEMLSVDVEQLKKMKENGIILEKDFSKERKQYARYIGKRIPGEGPEEREDVFAAIVALHDLRSENILTEAEFENKKRKLLKLL